MAWGRADWLLPRRCRSRFRRQRHVHQHGETFREGFPQRPETHAIPCRHDEQEDAEDAGRRDAHRSGRERRKRVEDDVHHPGETEGIEDIVRSRFLVLLCSEPAFHDLMRQGLEMEHVYHSADGVEVGRVNINDSVCYIPPVEDWGL